MFFSVPTASKATRFLFIQAPYPGRLKFDGLPSSLLHAISCFVKRRVALGKGDSIGILNPDDPTERFYGQLRSILSAGHVRVVGISTTTAAIGECARIVRVVREMSEQILVVAGGPHEDDCDRKIAVTIPGVDLSIGGDAEYILDELLARLIKNPLSTRRSFCTDFLNHFLRIKHSGRGQITSPWWPPPQTRSYNHDTPTREELLSRPHFARRIRFEVFDPKLTIPLMLTKGCAFGQCTFCAEGVARRTTRTMAASFRQIKQLCDRYSSAALYFQDSIFPNTPMIRHELLPFLRRRSVEWGAQVYLRMLSRDWARRLAEHGCTYLYTGVESASAEILDTVGKKGMNESLILQRVGWMRDCGIRVGVSLMFGAISLEGKLLETQATVRQTVSLARQMLDAGIHVAGFYPNVLTVLPGTRLAIALQQLGHRLDFYDMPQCSLFSGLEDGGVGYNFMTIRSIECDIDKEELAHEIHSVSRFLSRPRQPS